MKLTTEELDRVLATGDVDACLAFFKGASETERRTVAKRALEWARSAHHVTWAGILDHEKLTGPPESRTRDALPAARVAAYATCAWGDLRKLGHGSVPDADHAYAVLSDRRPSWLASWAAWVCQNAFNTHWLTVRRFEREGLIARTDVPAYWLAMAVHVPFNDQMGSGIPEVVRDGQGRMTMMRGGTRPRSWVRRPVREVLLEDPELLETHLWQMLEHEDAMARIAGEGQWTLPGTTGTGHRWSVALVELAQEGYIPRARLLDAALDGLGRATQRTGRWFADLVRALAPTPAEEAARTESLLRMLSAPTAAVVELGFEAALRLQENRTLPAALLAEHVGPALRARAKKTALSAVRLLETAVRQDASAAGVLALAVIEAFEHESAAVHERALGVIERSSGADASAAAERLRAKLEQVAPSQRARAEAWLQRASGTGPVPAPAPTTSSELGELRAKCDAVTSPLRDWLALDGVSEFADGRRHDVPRVIPDPVRWPRLDEGDRIRPIDDIDALIDTLLQLVEGASKADDAERGVCAMARLVAERPSDFAARTAPLRKRALDRLGPGGDFGHPAPFLGVDPVTDVCALVMAWTDGLALARSPGQKLFQTPWGSWTAPFSRQYTAHGFLSERLRRVSLRVAERRPVALLSEPTHRGGWIDPVVAVARAAAAQDPDLFDEILMLLRLAADGSARARADARSVPGELGAALRYALGGQEAIGETPALWVAAARTRAPHANDAALEARHPGLGPDAGVAAGYEFRVVRGGRGWLANDRPTVTVEWTPTLSVPERLDLPTVLFHGRHPGISSTLASGWESTLWLRGPDAFLSTLANGLATFLESQGSYWQGDWELLFHPDTPASPLLNLTILLGLAAKQPNAGGLARDALSAGIEDGRIDGTSLGQVLSFIIGADVVTHARWVAAFRDVARVSPLHAHVLQAALEQAAADLPAAPSARVVAVLETLLEWTTEAGEPVRSERTRARLAQITGAGRGAKLARALLALEENKNASSRTTVAGFAMRARLLRADRITARTAADR